MCWNEAPIFNGELWRIRGNLEIEQYEFSRYHWAVKEKDLFAVLHAAGYEFDVSSLSLFEQRPLPGPTPASLLSARNVIAGRSHTEIDDLLLEAGVAGLSAVRDKGGFRDRANAIVQFAIENPATVTWENMLLSNYLIGRALKTREKGLDTLPSPASNVSPVNPSLNTMPSADLSPNRVFVVHGQNETAQRGSLFLGFRRFSWYRTS